MHAGQRVYLDHLGTLERVHKPARVDVMDDGTRVLLPPHADVAFTEGVSKDNRPARMQFESLLIGMLGEDAPDIWQQAIAEVRKALAITKAATLPGVGFFESVDGNVAFEADDTLTQSVNTSFAGLAPIGTWSDSLNETTTDTDQVAEPETTEKKAAFVPVTLDPGVSTKAQDSDLEPQTSSAEPPENDLEIDKELEALISGVYVSQETIQDEPDAKFVDIEPVSHDAGGSTKTAAPVVSTTPPIRSASDRQRERHEERQNWTKFAVSLVVLAGIAALILFWPNPSSDALETSQANPGSAAELSALDSDSSVHAGGLVDSIVATPEELLSEQTERSLLEPDDTPAGSDNPPEPAANPLQSAGTVNPTSGGFTWVVGSGNEASANRAVSQYRSQGYKASVLPGEAHGLTVYRIALGQFSSREEANRFRSQLPAGAPPSSWILSLDTP